MSLSLALDKFTMLFGMVNGHLLDDMLFKIEIDCYIHKFEEIMFSDNLLRSNDYPSLIRNLNNGKKTGNSVRNFLTLFPKIIMNIALQKTEDFCDESDSSFVNMLTIHDVPHNLMLQSRKKMCEIQIIFVYAFVFFKRENRYKLEQMWSKYDKFVVSFNYIIDYATNIMLHFSNFEEIHGKMCGNVSNLQRENEILKENMAILQQKNEEMNERLLKLEQYCLGR